eukprot:761882-Hanusia_phi.AAC.3
MAICALNRMDFHRERSVSLDPTALNTLLSFRASLPDASNMLDSMKQKGAPRKQTLRAKERSLVQIAQNRLENAGWDTKMLEGLGLVDKETIKNLARSFEKDEPRPRKTWSLGPMTPSKPSVDFDFIRDNESLIKDDLSINLKQHEERDLEGNIAREYMETNISEVFNSENNDVDAGKDLRKSRWSMIQSLAGKLGSFSRRAAREASNLKAEDGREILKRSRTGKNRILATIKGLQANHSVVKGLLKMSVDSPTSKAEDVNDFISSYHLVNTNLFPCEGPLRDIRQEFAYFWWC